MIRAAGYICLWITFLPVLLTAQERVPSVAEMDAVINPPLLAGEKILYFDEEEINVGSMTEDSGPKVCHFNFRNISDDTVSILRVQTSCGCMKADFQPFAVAPGEKGNITIVFHPSGQSGTIYKPAFVYTGLSDRYPVAKIALRGEVVVTDPWRDYPYVMGSSLRMRRPEMRFSGISRTEIRTERLVCVNSGEKQLKLTAFSIPAWASFRTEPEEEIKAGEEADLVVVIDGRLLPPDIGNKFRFPIGIDGFDSLKNMLWVEVNLQNENIQDKQCMNQ